MCGVPPKAIESLINKGPLPQYGEFEITENLLVQYCNEYRNIKHSVPGFKFKKPSEIKFAKKMAGIILAKELDNRLSEEEPLYKVSKKSLSKTSKGGFVYVISNPAFEGYYKVGITTDLDSRLSIYQTGDPHRNYKYERTMYVVDRRLTEENVLKKFDVSLRKGEWINSETVKEMFHEYV